MNQGIYSVFVDFVEENTNGYEGYVINQSKYDRVVDICESLDALINELESEDIYLNANNGTKQFSIEIGCDEVIFQNGRSNVFFEIIQNTDTFSFAKREGGIVIMLFFDDLWVRA